MKNTKTLIITIVASIIGCALAFFGIHYASKKKYFTKKCSKDCDIVI